MDTNQGPSVGQITQKRKAAGRSLWRLVRWFWRHVEWAIYHRATIWERMAYDEGVARGMHCKHLRVIGPQMTREVLFYPGRKPERSFLTYREFMGSPNNGDQQRAP